MLFMTVQTHAATEKLAVIDSIYKRKENNFFSYQELNQLPSFLAANAVPKVIWKEAMSMTAMRQQNTHTKK